MRRSITEINRFQWEEQIYNSMFWLWQLISIIYKLNQHAVLGTSLKTCNFSIWTVWKTKLNNYLRDMSCVLLWGYQKLSQYKVFKLFVGKNIFWQIC